MTSVAHDLTQHEPVPHRAFDVLCQGSSQGIRAGVRIINHTVGEPLNPPSGASSKSLA